MRQLFLVFLAFGFFLLPRPALAYSNPGKPAGFVNDFAQLLTGDQRPALEAKLTQFTKDTSNEITVAIIPGLKGDTIENYAVELFKAWGIGQKNKDNGVLLLIALDEHKYRIEVGYGLEGALTDAQSFWIGQNIITPRFRAGDYYGGIDGAVDQIIAASKGEFVPSGGNTNGRSGNWWWLVTFAIFLFFLLRRSKRRGRFPWWLWFIGGGRGGSSSGSGDGFGGFGGGSSGGGGSSSSW